MVLRNYTHRQKNNQTHTQKKNFFFVLNHKKKSKKKPKPKKPKKKTKNKKTFNLIYLLIGN